MKRSRIFISHCSDDVQIMQAVMETIPELFSEYDVFCTFTKGIDVGKERAAEIRKNLLNSDVMIAFVTDSYLRSVICLSEISAFWLQDKPVFPIVYNGQTGRLFLEKLTGSDRIFFDVKSSKSEMIAAELKQILPLTKNAENAEAWVRADQSNPDLPAEGFDTRPYLGSEAVYEPILQYCIQSGIVRMQNRPIPSSLFRRKFLMEHPEEIWIVGTTNGGMIRSYAETLADAIAAGTDVYCMIGEKGSDFCNDVGAIEAFPTEFNGDKESWQKKADEEADRLQREYDSVIDQLRQIRSTATRKAEQLGTDSGHLYFGHVFTLLRQTLTLTINDTNNSLWAWLSVTIPPKKAADGTLGIEVQSLADDGNAHYRSLAESLKIHVREMAEVARFRNSLIEVSKDGKLQLQPERTEDKELKEARPQWEAWYASAERRMARRKKKDSGIDLIEIAAQHPLKNGKTPDTAYQQRLDFGIELYQRLKAQGRQVEIYVPGSVHIPDTVSLSAAGITYLKESGKIDEADILDEEINTEYKGKDGVYNSADECYVAAEIYKDGDYTDLHCICSANQMLRKKLFYFRFGVIPQMWALPDDSFHSDIGEIFESIPDVLLNDADWQKKESRHFIRTREERMPGWKDKS